MQGGLHPDFGIEWYEDLLRTLHQKYPTFQLHCFSPPEIHKIHRISGLDFRRQGQRNRIWRIRREPSDRLTPEELVAAIG